jgi:hypothetical protein
MPGYFRATAIVMTAGAITGAAVLAMLPSAPIDQSDDSHPPLFTILEGSGRLQVSCRQQLWVNSDRGCQTWTVPHPNVERILLEKTDAIGTGAVTENPGARAPAEIPDLPMPAPKSETPPVPPIVAQRDQVLPHITARHDESPPDRAAETVNAADARIVGGETVAEVRSRASPVPDDKTKVIRRSTDAARNIPVASRSADGTRRVIMIRPTSRQDVLYYSANSAMPPPDNTQVHGVVASFFNGLGGLVPH